MHVDMLKILPPSVMIFQLWKIRTNCFVAVYRNLQTLEGCRPLQTCEGCKYCSKHAQNPKGCTHAKAGQMAGQQALLSFGEIVVGASALHIYYIFKKDFC